MENQVFDEQTRTELMSMFTGMALPAAINRYDNQPAIHVGRVAVEFADAAVEALEEYHLRRRDELISARKAAQGGLL